MTASPWRINMRETPPHEVQGDIKKVWRCRKMERIVSGGTSKI
jgi:hypothetical protein